MENNKTMDTTTRLEIADRIDTEIVSGGGSSSSVNSTVSSTTTSSTNIFKRMWLWFKSLF